MNILIGFERSQKVCLAFRKKGHEAYSCDIEPEYGGCPEYHLQMDINKAIELKQWRFIGIHPVCTAMALSGNKHYSIYGPRYEERKKAVKYTLDLWDRVCDVADFAYMENPIGAMNTPLPPSQIIQPYYFGDPFQKTTCLWLYNLPPLFHAKRIDLFNDQITHVDNGEFIELSSGRKLPKWYSDAKSNKNYSEIRSETFPGIADAMADQWSNLISI